ncbi:hypothetical protein T484DRAFT_1902628 [Baffinella frigidus]|nr:hypothetical protein T484DRAFT_1902628 [Cryptophyta sp. CCMP2293]
MDGAGGSREQQACDAKWGSKFVEVAKTTAKVVCKPSEDAPDASSISCSRTPSGNPLVCQGRNMIVDFSKLSTEGNHRAAAPGTLSGDCTLERPISPLHERGGPLGLGSFQRSDRGKTERQRKSCKREETPLLVISHDDIGNTYHSLADLVAAFVSLAIAGVDPNRMQLLNTDHRIMCNGGKNWRGEPSVRLDCPGNP